MKKKLNRTIDRFLYRYNSSSYIIQNRARFLLYLILSITFIIPLIAFGSYLTLHNPLYNYNIQIRIFRTEILAFILSLVILFALLKGYFSIAGNLILLTCQSSLWSLIFFVEEEFITRIDTISMIIATLAMMPIIIVNRKKLFAVYTLINIALLVTFMFKNKLHFSETAFIDYLTDNTISFIIIGIISYTIFSINSRALEKAEKEIAERKKTEDHKNRLQMQLLQSQKLESVGLLAGGVAHDFNNMLAAVQGFAELAGNSVGSRSQAKEEIDEIIRASKKARDLTQQLLAFARIQPLDMKNLDINKIIRDFTGMLSRTLRSNIIIQNDLCDNPGSVECDPIQIEQVILNLTLNSQDAMPDGGTIIIKTARITVDADFAQRYENILPGSYLLLSVSDSGEGIDPDIADKIFDPFFTTKEIGKGTGLGLSTVYGIIKQHKGMIHLFSEKKSGTTFNIYLPVKDRAAEAETPPTAELIHATGNETILVVEDTAEVRNLLKIILKKAGYTALIAENAETALKIASSEKRTINLIITDVIIPDMNGIQLYSKIRELIPEIKVIYISGYTSNVIAPDVKSDKIINFIQKPFSISALTGKIREVLDS